MRTYHKFQVFRQCPPDDGQHTLEWVIGIVDSREDVSNCGPEKNSLNLRGKEIGSI